MAGRHRRPGSVHNPRDLVQNEVEKLLVEQRLILADEVLICLFAAFGLGTSLGARRKISKMPL